MNADLPDSYIFADDIESPVGAKLPLWMLGFCISHENHGWRICKSAGTEECSAKKKTACKPCRTYNLLSFIPPTTPRSF